MSKGGGIATKSEETAHKVEASGVAAAARLLTSCQSPRAEEGVRGRWSSTRVGFEGCSAVLCRFSSSSSLEPVIFLQRIALRLARWRTYCGFHEQ